MTKNTNPNRDEARSATPFIIGYIFLILAMFMIFVSIVLAMVGVIKP
jgi:hypothetical protein